MSAAAAVPHENLESTSPAQQPPTTASTSTRSSTVITSSSPSGQSLNNESTGSCSASRRVTIGPGGEESSVDHLPQHVTAGIQQGPQERNGGDQVDMTSPAPTSGPDATTNKASVASFSQQERDQMDEQQVVQNKNKGHQDDHSSSEDEEEDSTSSVGHHDEPASFPTTGEENVMVQNNNDNNNNINHKSQVASTETTTADTIGTVSLSSNNNIAQPSNNNNPSIFPTMAGPPHHSSFDMMRRGSMNSAAGFMDDSFFRRPSLGFDMNAMDNFFSNNRRDSMDSSTAALDAAILDLSRRRFSTMGAMSIGAEPPPTFASGSSASSQHESISQRQQQLKQQQRELEQRQRDLEFQRQQLIASMQERSYNISGMPTNTAPSASPYSYHHHSPHHHRGSLGMSAGGSLGLGSVHSHGSSTTTTANLPHSPYPHRSSSASGGSSSNQSWWVCQICNSKAFVSHEEAMQHESICTGMMMMMDPNCASSMNGMSHLGSKMMDNTNPGMNPLPMHDPLLMRTNPFFTAMDPTMDSSHRNMSLGLGTMDNSTRGVVSMGMDSSRGGSSTMGVGYDGSRHMSLGMDSSNAQSLYHDRMENPVSIGPFAMLNEPVPLAMPSDKDWLTPLHCFVRQHCVEVFTASESDVATPSKGKRKPIQVGQIGIRCPHCHAVDSEGNSKARERGSVYYPTSISSIYNATMNLLQRHLHSCPAVPPDTMARYETLKADDARSGTSKRYWVESARSLGLVDTTNGIRHSALRPPPLPTLTRQQESTNQTRRNSTEFFSSKSNADNPATGDAATCNSEGKDESINEDDGSESEANGQLLIESMSQSSALVADDDGSYATSFSYHLLSQMQQCVFTEADRLGKRKGLPPGFPGLACRHCFGGYGSGRFFPSSIKTLSDTSKTLNVLYNHMTRCRKCPKDIKKKLEGLRGSHDEERAKMKFGSQKAFFARIWERLHGKDAPGTLKRGIDPRSRMIHHHQQHHHQQQQHQQLQQSPPQHHHLVSGYAGRMHHQYPPPPMMHHHHHHMRSPQLMGSSSGLETLAAVSSPANKRQKLEHSV
jgi:hypothetical protein